ncbi:Protein of unknown function [Pustulibacterium marinum]|uniref:DUF2911 domain-containing protein n=1 Tax=Pustulibacterium marinum TaxID=1224947 RepID=A0A1I7HZZ7_9FLAO|nr:DUF2911 domain-containing protein [Pustulibacterium marinum]SFU66268.1 Protein of unknown function [Pustulibacterium marinum]
MKNFKLFFLAVISSVAVNAQITTPQPSPHAKIEQRVGLTDITVTYSRPSMKGREIFGDLVPFEKIWRTGANENTVITFSDDVMIAGNKLTKGSYAIYTKPRQKNWDVIFYTDTNNWGAPKELDESKIAAVYVAETMRVPFDVETFTIDFNNLTNNSGSLEFLWASTYVAVPFEVMTKEKAMASIEKALNGPSAGDYYAAASYYYEENMDISKAKTYIDKAVEMQGNKVTYWMLRKQSLIYAKAGDKKGAIAVARKSLDGALKAGNQDYVKMNEESLKEWGAK